MDKELKPCQTCARLTDESEMVVARLAARMGCAFVCKECGHKAQDRLAAPDLHKAASEALVALQAIASGNVDPAIWPDLAVRYERFAEGHVANLQKVLGQVEDGQ